MEPLGIGARVWLAIIIPWRLLFDGVFARRVSTLDDQPQLAPTKQEPVAAPSVTEPEPDVAAAMQLLAIMQREGRFVDFLQEDVTAASDAEIGAAARVVHEGCKRGLADYVELEPIRNEAEGTAIELQPGFDAMRTRVTGNVVGEPPFSGKLAHHGWQVRKIRMPSLSKGHDPKVVAPAEVEL